MTFYISVEFRFYPVEFGFHPVEFGYCPAESPFYCKVNEVLNVPPVTVTLSVPLLTLYNTPLNVPPIV